MYRLYEKSRLRPDMNMEREILHNDRCLIERDSSMARLLQSSNIFLIETEQLCKFLHFWSQALRDGRNMEIIIIIVLDLQN